MYTLLIFLLLKSYHFLLSLVIRLMQIFPWDVIMVVYKKWNKKLVSFNLPENWNSKFLLIM